MRFEYKIKFFLMVSNFCLDRLTGTMNFFLFLEKLFQEISKNTHQSWGHIILTHM
jgi:hypothetical protein